MERETILKPGFLVSLKTSVKGNVRYNRHTLESDHIDHDGALRAKWQTEKTVIDPAEHEAAKKARADARNIISAACANSAFGLLCPESGYADLQTAISTAESIVRTFNAGAKLSEISVYVITGRIEANDRQAARALNSEVSDLLMDMETGLAERNVETVRQACNKARDVSVMLTAMAAIRLEAAIDATRTAARKIVKGDGANESAVAVKAIGHALECFEESR